MFWWVIVPKVTVGPNGRSSTDGFTRGQNITDLMNNCSTKYETESFNFEIPPRKLSFQSEIGCHPVAEVKI